MANRFSYARQQTMPTSLAWWFAPIGGFLVPALLWSFNIPMTFSHWLPDITLLRGGFEVLVCIIIAYSGIFLFWLLAYPIHSKFEAQGGFRFSLKQRLGAQMGPLFLIGFGLVIFAILTTIGMAWLTFQFASGNFVRTIGFPETPNTVGNPDFAVFPPERRYKFTWDPSRRLSFYVRLDTQKNPDFSNNPAFLIRNKTNTVAYRVKATWQSETSMDLKTRIAKSSKFSAAAFDLTDTQLVMMPANHQPTANYIYYLEDSPTQEVAVVAKEAEIYFPLQLLPLLAIYLIDEIPDKIGETSQPFISRLTLNWETAEGKRQRAFRIRTSATNAKASLDGPVVDSYLNFNCEEIGQWPLN